ncbi:MAG TPA: CinA family nicotinamide mononucleotide deamidase-related protein [Chloroflexia bacterium]|nr:CinA family nicotinamide mononucleotide deamidase-related protein [Chloroflexia bacterium]
MRAEIVSIGTELLLGSITDTNASYLAQRLALLGIDCFYISQVGDNPARLQEILARAWGRSDLTVTTGGLGPTVDDLTREAIAEMLGETLYTDKELAEHVRQFFARRGSPMPEANLKQAALIPSGAPIDNPIGTAPGWWVSRQAGGTQRIMVSMPGVPFEMKRMWEIEVEPRLRELSPTRIVSRTLKVLGMGESAVEQVVVDLMSGSNPTLAPYAKQDGIHLRITAKAGTEEAARAMIEGLEEQVRSRLGRAVYGADDESPSGAVLALLERAGVRLAVLEVGEGAIGSVSPQLATSQLVVGSTAARDLGHAAQLLGTPQGAQDDLDLPGLALQAAKNGADVVLALAGRVADSPGRTGSVEAECEVVVVWTGGPSKEPVRASYRWRTARSEVSRLFGLMSLNQLRLVLLEQES